MTTGALIARILRELAKYNRNHGPDGRFTSGSGGSSAHNPRGYEEFPLAGPVVDGLRVGDHIKNAGSISASVDDPIEQPGIRAIPVPDPGPSPNLGYSNVRDQEHVRELAAAIERNGYVDPLILVQDAYNPDGYWLEGNHRYQALRLLGKTHVPALVVWDNTPKQTYNRATGQWDVEKYNRNHDPKTGRFVSGSAGSYDHVADPLGVFDSSKPDDEMVPTPGALADPKIVGELFAHPDYRKTFGAVENRELSSLKHIQSEVSRQGVREYLRLINTHNPEYARPQPLKVVRYRGQEYVVDGHHRMTAARIRGDRTVDVVVQELAPRVSKRGNPYHKPAGSPDGGEAWIAFHQDQITRLDGVKKYNRNHDPKTGRFTSGSGGSSAPAEVEAYPGQALFEHEHLDLRDFQSDTEDFAAFDAPPDPITDVVTLHHLTGLDSAAAIAREGFAPGKVVGPMQGWTPAVSGTYGWNSNARALAELQRVQDNGGDMKDFAIIEVSVPRSHWKQLKSDEDNTVVGDMSDWRGSYKSGSAVYEGAVPKGWISRVQIDESATTRPDIDGIVTTYKRGNPYHKPAGSPDGGEFTGPNGSFSAAGTGYSFVNGQWQTADGTPAPPAHVETLRRHGVARGYRDARINSSPTAGLQVRAISVKTGREKRFYSAEHQEAAHATKFARVKAFSAQMPRILTKVDEHLSDPKSPHHQEAVVTRLLAVTGLRVGSETNMHDGLTTLRGENVTIRGGAITLDFIGKSGVRNLQTVQDPQLARALKARITGPQDRLFSVSRAQVLGYVKAVAGKNFKTKDFRTWTATFRAKQFLDGHSRASNAKEFAAIQRDVAKKVSGILGNTPAIALKSYIDPSVWDGVRN